MLYPIVRRALCDAQKGLFLAKGVDMMSSSSPVAAALLTSTWDVFHNLTDFAHEMTLPCSKERHEASDATSRPDKTRFQIWNAVTDDVTPVGRGFIEYNIDLPETRRRRPRGSQSRRSRRRRSPAPVPGRESRLRGRWGEAATLRSPRRRTSP